MTSDIRMSGPTLKVLKMMIEKPRQRVCGAEISKGASIGSGTLYPLLQRLESAGWLKSEWEDIDASQEGRPRRRFYKLTGKGQTQASKELSAFQTSPQVLSWNS